MRALGRLALTVMVAALLVGLVVAQRFFGGGGGFGGAGLLENKSVQEELKMSEEQTTKAKKAIQDVRAKYKEDFGKVFQIEDKSERDPKFAELAKKVNDETMKEVDEILKPEQIKRFKQIQLQVRGPDAYRDEEVQKTLKLTDDQKDKIKTIMEDFGKEAQEIFKDAGGDFKAAGKKVQDLRKETQDKITGLLTDDQKKAWTELTGKPFELKMEFGGGKGKGKGKKGKEKKKDTEKKTDI